MTAQPANCHVLFRCLATAVRRGDAAEAARLWEELRRLPADQDDVSFYVRLFGLAGSEESVKPRL